MELTPFRTPHAKQFAEINTYCHNKDAMTAIWRAEMDVRVHVKLKKIGCALEPGRKALLAKSILFLIYNTSESKESPLKILH
jgi:hypothetical protein